MSAFTESPFAKAGVVARVSALSASADYQAVYLAIDPERGHIPGVAAMRIGCCAVDLDVMIAASRTPKDLATTIHSIRRGQSLFGHGLMALSMWFDAITGLTWKIANPRANCARLLVQDALKYAAIELSDASNAGCWRNYDVALVHWNGSDNRNAGRQDLGVDAYSPASDQSLLMMDMIEQIGIARSLLSESPIEPIQRNVVEIAETLLMSRGTNFRPTLTTTGAVLPINCGDLVTAYVRRVIQMGGTSFLSPANTFRAEKIMAWANAAEIADPMSQGN